MTVLPIWINNRQKWCSTIDVSYEAGKHVEVDENIMRRDFTNSEIYAIQQYFHDIESDDPEVQE